MDIRDQYAYLKPQPFVWFAILMSVGVHLLLVGVIVVGGLLEEHRPPLKDQAIITRLVQKGERRPENWLPRKPVEQPQAPAPPQAVSPKTPTEASVPVRPRQKTGPEAKSRRVDYSKDMESALTALRDEKPEGAPDGVEGGDSALAQRGNEYLTKVYKAIKAKYEVPELIPERERMFLKAEVVIFLDAGGNIRDLRLKGSGNALFDSAVEGAVRRAAPFPPPPPELAATYAKEGIGIPFHARKM